MLKRGGETDPQYIRASSQVVLSKQPPSRRKLDEEKSKTHARFDSSKMILAQQFLQRMERA
jgi:hypothetical protein